MLISLLFCKFEDQICLFKNKQRHEKILQLMKDFFAITETPRKPENTISGDAVDIR